MKHMKNKPLAIIGLGLCFSVACVSMVCSFSRFSKLKADNETFVWDIPANKFGISTGSPRDYFAKTPGNATVYFHVYGCDIQETYLLFHPVESESDNPSYLVNYEEIDEDTDELISAIRGIKSIELKGEDEHINELGIFVGEEGCRGSFSDTSSSRENFVPISEMKDDVNYCYFFIENTSEFSIFLTGISMTYSCVELPSSDKYPFIYKASGEGEEIEYAVRFDTEFTSYPFSTGKDLMIPDVYNGYPVNKIYGEEVESLGWLQFDNLDRNLCIPDSIIEIGPDSFASSAFNDDNSGLIFGDGVTPVSWTAKKGSKTKTLIFNDGLSPHENGELLTQYYDYTLTRNS